MAVSYLQISPEVASSIRLVMTDVDGTLTSDGRSFNAEVSQAIRQLKRESILVGLISGRNMQRLESLASELAVNGPLIGENGGVAKLKAGGEPVDLGYSRQPAVDAFQKLKRLFPDAVEDTEYNPARLVDYVIRVNGVSVTELSRHLEGAQLLDSGYMLHLLPQGVSKGRTLMRLLDRIAGGLSPEQVMVFGDSPTDVSLFQLFPHSVLIPNPVLSAEDDILRKAARYESALPSGEGFAQVVFHFLKVRHNSAVKK
ncbi:MAG: HAD-IIB family hydrolase [Chloroflexi bacterium]|nr:HAD-IIB family hydrolase [Chloroflexota bacterium]